MLCRGDRCGPSCEKWHAPVDVDIDNVLTDVWGRAWMTSRGKKCSSDEAEQFQVLARIPKVCVDGLQQTSSNDGIYYEVRHQDGRSPSPDMIVLWLPHLSLQQVQHKLKTLDRGIAVARFAGRYGVRAFCRDGPQLHKELELGDDYNQVTVQEIYEIRPLPHGIQKAGVTALLKKWGWAARPLQPYRGDQHGMGWLVGSATAPPEPILCAAEGDVMASLRRKTEQDKANHFVLSSSKTRNHIKQTKKTMPLQDKENISPAQPWAGVDPWSGHWCSQLGCSSSWRTHRCLDVELTKRVEEGMKAGQEQRFQRLETGLTELQQQNGKFEQWFKEAGAAQKAVQHQVNTLTTQVQKNASDMGSLSDKLDTGFATLTAMLSKKQRTDSE